MTVANGAPDPGLFRQCAAAEESAQVECQGMTVRQRPDVPVAGDEEILRLSDPPYYSAWPNPFLAEFIERRGRPYDPDEPYQLPPRARTAPAGGRA